MKTGLIGTAALAASIALAGCASTGGGTPSDMDLANAQVYCDSFVAPLDQYKAEAGAYPARLSALPFYAESSITYYRTDLFKEAGLTMPERPTWEQIGDFAVTLESVSPVAGPNWTAIEAGLAVRHDGGEPVFLTPQARNFWSPPQSTSESALLTKWNGQLYAVIGNQAEDGRWQIRMWWKPFVTFIWYGGILIALGGVLAIAGRVRVDVKRRSATSKGAQRRADLEALGSSAPVPAE